MFLQIDDLLVHCVVEGPEEAPPLLLLHSIGTSLHVWDPQMAALTRRYRVIRVDLRGHGLTGVSPGDYGMARLARDAIAVLDALGIASAHVGGLSIGGRIALEMAALAPERVASLLLVCTALEFPDPATWQARIEAVRQDGTAALVETVMPRWVAQPEAPDGLGLRAMLLRTDRAGYAGAAAALRDARAADLPPRFAQPATIIAGEADPAVPEAALKALRGRCRGATLVSLPCQHIPNYEEAAAVSRAMLAHLDGLVEAPANLLRAGQEVRKAVLGEAHVARAAAAATALDRPFQDYITRNVWGQIWTRPGLPRHSRSLLTLAMMAALGRHEEFVLHVKATRQTGVTPEELSEVLLQVGAYAGVPAANHALKLAKQAYQEMEAAAG
ncbi:4-carboxymuconolactone decarboxylase [Pseudoroseomonas cervicalis]|uniref:bifunctional 3-oxoadipate enol-lactonase/4-carboxymuconolactone decarboxylase PcaDC n=1 Tax=Teichococcus cervicalis TaxID=204525 RepID=UPI002784431B|nr:4-carboxymuconolactone decarboxylase [Pseudoroseomonas cervicalis]MDQ1078635.1 3-oxoadipate enol-lactonase/4-carboxymuconolactone decarboxylase [Pseudoroseomonas cervicalis]